MQDISPESPEERGKRFAKARAKFGKQIEKVRPGTYPFEVLKRVSVGVYNDGFIHAGNLAYLALLTLFPFVIVAAAVARLFGQTEEGMTAVIGLLQTMPPSVAEVLQKPIADVLTARSGNLLWLGALVGLWTTTGFIETIRDIIRRAYGVRSTRPFWEYRVRAIGIIIGSVVLAMIAFSISVVLSSVQSFVVERLPGGQDLGQIFTLLRFAPAAILFLSLWLLFWSLTPGRYRKKQCRTWPGPLFVTIWWLGTTAALPWALSKLGGYDLTYGSLAGIIIAMTFFFIVGLGVVFGAELNAALAETPEEGIREGEEAFYKREGI